MRRFHATTMADAEKGEIEEAITEEKDETLSRILPESESESDQILSVQNGRKNSESNQNKTEEIQETVNLREIAKDLKKIKKQNFITHCLLSALIVITLTWQCGEVSFLLSVKNKVTNPVKMVGDLFKDKISNKKGNNSTIEGYSLPSIGLNERSDVDLELFPLTGAK